LQEVRLSVLNLKLDIEFNLVHPLGRCYIFDCHLHFGPGSVFPLPRKHTEAPPPPLCSVPGLSLLSDSLRRPEGSSSSNGKDASAHDVAAWKAEPAVSESASPVLNSAQTSSSPARTTRSAVKADIGTIPHLQLEASFRKFAQQVVVNTAKLIDLSQSDSQSDQSTDEIMPSPKIAEKQVISKLASGPKVASQGSSSQYFQFKYCLYCSDPSPSSSLSAAVEPASKWTAAEDALCEQLLEVFADSDCKYEEVARCLGSRTPAAVQKYCEEVIIRRAPTAPTFSAEHKEKKAKSVKKSASNKKRSSSLKKILNVDYEPCNHDGRCISSLCGCAKAGTNCEKFCGCDVKLCGNRFDGCRCKSVRNACGTNSCPCHASGRECDPILCGQCGAGIHPFFMGTIQRHARRSGDVDVSFVCRNSSLRRGDNKMTGIGQSDIQGWGLFVKEAVEKGELVSEYKGEVISKIEAERRGSIYDHVTNCSYLFTLNDESDVDSTRLGNNVKFVNHMDGSKSNCQPLIKVVDRQGRIGLFAKRAIKAGEELSFDYQYTAEAAPDWLSKGKHKRKDGDSKSSESDKKRVKIP
jgi:hypothetical protein